ncbi:MAG: 16S rRNA (cytosine(1402)-N(4))-methyltransferase RsmH, partial [Firmicutes bacterium]|nr:16S rRNA (cytosine(1402)-N(4))-methyltransferase RsmH [Bacillota bacterium]
MEFKHISVLLDECINSLNIKKGGIYVDGTMGGGGHSLHIARALDNTGTLIGIDRDSNAIKAAGERLAGFNNVKYIHNNFSHIEEIAKELDIDGIDGILLDLGVSSHQLDEADRGFSYQHNAVLDMRMDVRNSLSAYSVVNTYTKDDLYRVIRDYGEEKWAKRIAEFIVEQRKEKPIETTFDLVSV